MVMSMKIMLGTAPPPRFSIPDRFGPRGARDRPFPQLSDDVLQQLLDDAVVRGSAALALDDHLQQHPDALAAPAGRAPLSLVRLADTLISRGIEGVEAPKCSRCGRASR